MTKEFPMRALYCLLLICSLLPLSGCAELNIAGDNLFLIATFPTLLICWYKKGSLFGALAVGMGTVALIRYWMT